MAQKYIGITLPVRLGQTGMFEQSTTLLQQVRSNFKNLILTKKGERVMQPDFGCDLWKVLFEQSTDELEETARLSVVDALERWMPFVELTQFEVTQDRTQNLFTIKSDYRFRSNPNVTDSVVIQTDTTGTPVSGDSVVFSTPRRTINASN